MQNGSLRGPREDKLPHKVMEDFGRTALHEAAISGDEKTLNILLSGGADRNLKDQKHGNTPLHEAAWRGYSRSVKALCALPQPKNKKEIKESKIKGVLQDTRGALHSALLGTRNNGGFSALHLAAQNGHNQSCREILLAGADPDVQNNYGDTPLHTACRYGHAGATRILLSARCDPNRSNLNGDSPLHIACAMGRRKLTKILLEAGSNQELRNAQNETPKDIAIRKSLAEILEILNSPIKVKIPWDRDRSSNNSKQGDQPDGTKSSPGAKKKPDEEDPNNIVNWSPYGCHYFPDPRCFPPPKLETLPKEPLQKGEQYYLDLAGNIRKGPIGVGNTCYCGPFFRHIEDRITKNRKSLRKYVHKATEKLDNKVQALALRTDDQIEQLTKSMLADRVRCEGRAIHLEQWLNRGQTGRLTSGMHTKSKKNIENSNTLSKCRSLEFLDGDDFSDKKLQNSRSFDMLDEANVIVHRSGEGISSAPSSSRKASKTSDRSKEVDPPPMRGLGYSLSKRLEELLLKTNQILEMEKMMRRKRKETASKSPKEQLKVSSRRQSLYINDVADQVGAISLDPSPCSSRSKGRVPISTDEEGRTSSSLKSKHIINCKMLSDPKLPSLSPEISKECPSQKELERKSEAEHERSSILSGSSHRNLSSTGSGYGTDSLQQEVRQNTLSPSLQCNRDYQNIIEAHEDDSERKFKDLIIALRKDYNTVRNAIENEFIKEAITTDNLSNGTHYSNLEQLNSSPVESQHPSMVNIQQMLNGFYQNSDFDDVASSSNNTLKSEKRQPIIMQDYPDSETRELPELANSSEIKQLKNRILNGSNWRSEVLKQQSQRESHHPVTVVPNPQFDLRSSVHSHEARNGEVKSLRSPKLQTPSPKNKVQTLVARLQGRATSQCSSVNLSESSEDEGDGSQHTSAPHELPYYSNRPQSQLSYHNGSEICLPTSHAKMQAQVIDTRNLIPKDAYFHDMPNKNRHLPVADKLPDKQMLQFTESFQMARTRNPLPYSTDYDIEISALDSNTAYYPPREKLLTNRKFSFSNSSSTQFPPIHVNPQLQQPLQIQMPQMIAITPEQAQMERDANNDSGYSTKICGSSHGPSPSLSGHTDYSGMGMSAGHGVMHVVESQHHLPAEHVNPNEVPYYIGGLGASSLV